MTTEPLTATGSPIGATLGGEPTGLVTFLFTDIEGSTRLWEQHGPTMGAALTIHDQILRDGVAAAGGSIVKTTGDGMLAAFDDPVAAVHAAIAIQRALASASWPATGPLRVRMAIHSGAAQARDGDYFGPALNRVARILAIGHGAQVLASAATAVLTRDTIEPEHLELLDLGSHRLRDLDRPEQVFQVTAPDLPRTFPPLRSLSTRRTNLPVQLTSFVGRERELGEVQDLIRRHRLVTLIGTGGTGKTRLMLEAAGRIGDGFEDGVWLAELAPLGDASQVASEIGRALGVPEEAGQAAITTVTAFLGGKELLLLLDNAEHLVDAVAEVAERLLASAPGLRIITTSREALAVPGEAVLHVQSLACPSIQSVPAGGGEREAVDLAALRETEAIRLFVERAAAVAPEFELRDANAPAVIEICRRLDGIPLAIELAAARVSAMSPGDIATRLGDRFRLLAGGRRTAVPRQQTLHALIDWSWDLLTEADRRLLRRLSIFAGGWTAEMACAIVEEDGRADEVELLDGLQRLVDRSLVIVDRGETTRYRMLETIRQYGRERLVQSGEATSLADRHFTAFAALAADAERELRGPAMADWLDRLDADIENLGAALEWGLEADPWAAVRMANALLAYWASRVASADSEARILAAIEIARSRIAEGEASGGADPADLALAAKLLGEAGRVWAMSGRADVARGWAEEAVRFAEASGDPAARVQALSGLGVAYAFSGRGYDPQVIFGQAIDLAQASGTWWVVAMSAGFSGASTYHEDPVSAEALVARGVEAAARSGSPYAIGAAAMARGRMLGLKREPDAAAASFEESMRRFTEIGDLRLALAARSDMAHALRRSGRFDEAMAVYRQTVDEWVHLGNRGAVGSQLENVAYVAIERGELARAATLLGAAEAIRETASSRMAWDEIGEFEAYVARLRAALPGPELDAAWSQGRGSSLRTAVELVRAG